MADSTLVNGKGRFVGGPNAELAIIGVERGKRYRFRLISISCDPNYTFSIDSHNLIVIEVEGTLVQPYTVNTIQILAGKQASPNSPKSCVSLTEVNRATLLLRFERYSTCQQLLDSCSTQLR